MTTTYSPRRARTMARERLDGITVEHALDLIRSYPPNLTGGTLRAYVGALLDRVSVFGGMQIARSLGVRNPAEARLRLERQIMGVLEP